MNLYIYNKKNKEENSTAQIKASVKVEMCWENKQCDYKRKNKKGKII